MLAMARRSSIVRTLIGKQRMAQLYRTFDFVDGDYSVEILAPKELMTEMQARCRSGPPDEEMKDTDLN